MGRASSCAPTPLPASPPTTRAKDRIKDKLRESFEAVHPAARRNFTVDGGNSASGRRGVFPVARLGAAAGRLSDASGTDVLSRRQSRRNGFGRYHPSRASVRASSRPEPDDIDEFLWLLADHASV